MYVCGLGLCAIGDMPEDADGRSELVAGSVAGGSLPGGSTVDLKECSICCTDPRATRFHPCGHAVACVNCALQIVAHSADTSEIQCPTCKQLIQAIEEDKPDAPVSIARQVTFKLARAAGVAAFDPTAAPQFATANSSSIEAFVEKHSSSESTEIRSSAEAAKKTLASGGQNDDMSRFLAQIRAHAVHAQQPVHVSTRAVCGLLIMALTATWLASLVTAFELRAALESYLATDAFSVFVTRLDGVSAPLNALIPSSVAASAEALHALTELLLVPDDSQRWWSLIPADQGHGKLVASTQDITKARYWLYLLALFEGFRDLTAALASLLSNRPNIRQAAGQFGLTVTLSTAMLFALHAMYWDGGHGLVMLMYAPTCSYLQQHAHMCMCIPTCTCRNAHAYMKSPTACTCTCGFAQVRARLGLHVVYPLDVPHDRPVCRGHLIWTAPCGTRLSPPRLRDTRTSPPPAASG